MARASREARVYILLWMIKASFNWMWHQVSRDTNSLFFVCFSVLFLQSVMWFVTFIRWFFYLNEFFLFTFADFSQLKLANQNKPRCLLIQWPMRPNSLASHHKLACLGYTLHFKITYLKWCRLLSRLCWRSWMASQTVGLAQFRFINARRSFFASWKDALITFLGRWSSCS